MAAGNRDDNESVAAYVGAAHNHIDTAWKDLLRAQQREGIVAAGKSDDRLGSAVTAKSHDVMEGEAFRGFQGGHRAKSHTGRR